MARAAFIAGYGKTLFEFSRSLSLARKGEKVISEGHPQTPDEGQSPSAHPIFQQPASFVVSNCHASMAYDKRPGMKGI